MKNLKKIGIIGGVGPQATEFIYRKITEFSQLKYGAKNNDEYPNIFIESIPIPDFIGNKNQLPKAKAMLFECIKRFECIGASRLAIASNTVHILLDELSRKTSVKFLSVIELVAKKCAVRQYKKVGLLGTPVLLKSKLYENELKKYNIQILYPSNEDINISEQIIRDVLAGRKNGTLKEKYIKLLHDLFDQDAQAIILGCTELPLAINYEALGNKTLNSDEVLAEAIVDYYYQ